MSDFFHLISRGSTVKRELIAALTTFATLAYLLVVIPSILAETGMDEGALFVATALIAAYSTAVMGLLAHYPFVLCSGIAMSVYFTYSVVLGEGLPWQTALGVVFLTGVTLLLLSLFHIRQRILQAIPFSLRLATLAGLGLFIALIGLKNAGIIVSHPHTLLGFGHVHSWSFLLVAVGLITMGILLTRRVTGALFLGIVLVWLLALLVGLTKWQGMVSWPASLAPLWLQLDVKGALDPALMNIFLSFLFVALFDTTGTLIGLAEEGQFIRPHDSDQRMSHFPRVTQTLIPDSTGTILASFLGTGPVVVCLESAAGLHAGGKTGLTALFAALLFLVSLFFAPFVTSIPAVATTPVLVIVGGMMLKSLSRLDWKDPTEWLPAFITLVLIPLTFSIANGIGAGFITYCLIKLFTGKRKEVHWLSWILALLFVLKFLFFPS